MTPLVMDGVMYVTGPNQVSALDARVGPGALALLAASHARTQGDAAIGLNRGVALLADRVFFVTDDAHLLALSRLTGALLWEARLPEEPTWPYGGTMAPLVIGDLVIAGVSGGDDGIRGFIAAYNVSTGTQVWRFWTVPARGEPAVRDVEGQRQSRRGRRRDVAHWHVRSGHADVVLAHGQSVSGHRWQPSGAATTSTPTRIVALDAKTGKLRWHFQFTPHDLHDWDAQSPLVLVDTTFQGAIASCWCRRIATAFSTCWTAPTASSSSASVREEDHVGERHRRGRPSAIAAGQYAVSRRRTLTCPAIRGATNWMSTSYHPGTRLFYVMAVENCGIYRTGMFRRGGRECSAPAVPRARRFRRPARTSRRGSGAGRSSAFGGNPTRVPAAGGRRCFGPSKSKPARSPGRSRRSVQSNNYAGTLATAGGLVFYAQSRGEFAAVDARTDRHLWHFEGQEAWKASPMTYMVDGRQYVAIAAAPTSCRSRFPRQPPGNAQQQDR